MPFLFGVYPGLTGGTIGIADGNVVDNRFTLYRIGDNRGPLTAAEMRAEPVRAAGRGDDPAVAPG